MVIAEQKRIFRRKLRGITILFAIGIQSGSCMPHVRTKPGRRHLLTAVVLQEAALNVRDSVLDGIREHRVHIPEYVLSTDLLYPPPPRIGNAGWAHVRLSCKADPQPFLSLHAWYTMRDPYFAPFRSTTMPLQSSLLMALTYLVGSRAKPDLAPRAGWPGTAGTSMYLPV